MSLIPATKLQQFIGMDDYERMLSVDRLARELGISAAQIEAEIERFLSGEAPQQSAIESSSQISAPTRKSQFSSHQEDKEGSPKFLDESHKYRFTYDPSPEGKKRQSTVKQAIMCPHCNAALGIPPTRPIRVTCPACMMDATFEN